MSLISELPVYICLEFLKTWLKLDEICRLDSGFCESSNRDKYLKLFLKTDTFWPDMNAERVPSDHLLCWLAIRGIKMRNIEVNLISQKNNIHQVLQHHRI